MDITLAHLQIFNDYLCALSLYLSFLFVFFYFLFAHLKACGYLKEEVPTDRSSYREISRTQEKKCLAWCNPSVFRHFLPLFPLLGTQVAEIQIKKAPNVFLVSDIIMLIPIAELTLLVFETFNTFEYCLWQNIMVINCNLLAFFSFWYFIQEVENTIALYKPVHNSSKLQTTY